MLFDRGDPGHPPAAGGVDLEDLQGEHFDEVGEE